MRRESLLAGGAILVIAAAALAAVLVPGAIADPTIDDDEPPGHVAIEEMTISTDEVTGETATLSVDTRLDHRGGVSENVSVTVRAVAQDSGMVETTAEQEFDELAGTHERSVPTTLTVPRDGDYRIEAIVYENEARTADAATVIRNLDALTPPRAETPVEFHRFDGASADTPPVIQYSVEGVEDNETTLAVSTYLTNTGDEPESALELLVQARQADSNVVADEARIDVGAIDGGETATPTVELAVPDSYDYYLDATLWDDGVIVGDARSAANLAPGDPLTVNTTDHERTLEIEAFADDDPDRPPEPVADDEADADRALDEDGPGFGIAAVVVALLVTLALTRRSS